MKVAYWATLCQDNAMATAKKEVVSKDKLSKELSKEFKLMSSAQFLKACVDAEILTERGNAKKRYKGVIKSLENK